MRPIHAVILILAGALGGALIMKVAPKARTLEPVPTVAQVQAPASPVITPDPPPAPPAEPQVQQPADQEPPQPPAAKPSPMPRATKPVPRHEAPAPVRSQTAEPTPASDPEPVERPAEVAAPAPPPSSPTIAPPPANPEPEHVTPRPQASVAPAPQPHQVTLNAGLLLPVRLVDGLSSARNAPGDTFTATLDKPLVVDGFVIAERGARVEGRVVAADRGGKVRGVAALAVELTRLYTSDGQKVPIQTEDYFKRSDVSHTDDATKIGAGAAIGAVIGALAGGGKGAAIGAGLGGGAGAGDVLLTRGKPAELPSEARVTFHLKNPVPLTERLR